MSTVTLKDSDGDPINLTGSTVQEAKADVAELKQAKDKPVEDMSVSLE
mgnify:CR=1 FL=1